MKEWAVEAQAAGGHSIINDITIKGCFLCPTYPTDRTLSVTFTHIEIVTIYVLAQTIIYFCCCLFHFDVVIVLF